MDLPELPRLTLKGKSAKVDHSWGGGTDLPELPKKTLCEKS